MKKKKFPVKEIVIFVITAIAAFLLVYFGLMAVNGKVGQGTKAELSTSKETEAVKVTEVETEKATESETERVTESETESETEGVTESETESVTETEMELIFIKKAEEKPAPKPIEEAIEKVTEAPKNILYCCANEYVTLRESPSTYGKEITRIPCRGEVEWFSTDGAFYYVEYKGNKGYALGEFFSPDLDAPLNYSDGSQYNNVSSANSATQKSESATKLYCRASDFATLRKSASVDSTALAKITTREMVEMIDTSGKFYYVSYKGTKGYVLKDYFSTDPNAELNYGLY